jgi:RNA polymerase sigma factor (sigma-70 family)
MKLALQGTSSTTCTEHELVAAVRRGDDRAFEVLFSRYERRITAYVAGMVGDHARAEDITQDVFISALRRMRETERPIAFKPWIYEIAKNACIDEFRRARRAHEVSFEEGDGSTVAARAVYIHAPAPQAAIESKQRLDDLCGAFGGLSESHHRVLVLRELEGLSYSEIGERLGMTRAMVESTLFRARRRLSEEYEELSSGRRCARVQSLIEARGEQPLTSLGIRDRRQVARHLAHCRPCRRRARFEGIDESLLEPRRGIAKIAALLPLPLLRWRRGASSEDRVAQSGSHSVAVAQSLQNVAQLVDPLGPSAAFGRAAAAAAAIAIAGAGGGLVVNLGASGGATPRIAPAHLTVRIPVLSITKILAPVKTSRSAPQAGAVFAWPAPAAAGGGPAQASAAGSGGQQGGATISLVGSGAGHSTGGDANGPGAGQSGGGPTTPAGGNGSSTGTPPSTPGGGVSVPSGVGGSGSASGGGGPSVPSSQGGSPSVSGPQVQTTPPPTGPEVPVSAPVSVPPQAQSVVESPSTATQTVSAVQQSVPAPPTNTAVRPPPGA